MVQKINYFVKSFLETKFKHHINILNILEKIGINTDLNKKIIYLYFSRELDMEIFKYNCLKDLNNHLSTNNLEYDVILKINKEVDKKIPENKIEKFEDNFLNKFIIPNDKTFKNFILADFNKKVIDTINFALKNNAGGNNKIFIYSKSGLGKSHLLYAIYNSRKKKSIYLNTPTLIREYQMLKGNFSKFVDYLNKFDILLIDDVQFLEKNNEVNNIFFSVIDIFLLSQSKKIFIASDTPINLLINLESRILTRLESFMSIEIEEPTPDTIMKIINYKIKHNLSQYEIDNDAIQYIANNFYENIRKIDGIFTTIIFNLINKNIDHISLEFLKNILSKNITGNKKIDYIFAVEEVSKYINISEYELLNCKKNDKSAVLGNALTYYLLYNIYNYSYEDINNIFSNKNIKNIKSGISKINKEIFKDKKLQKFIDVFKYKFYKKTNN